MFKGNVSSRLLLVLFVVATVGCFKKKDEPADPEIAAKVKAAHEIAEHKTETPPAKVEPLTELVKSSVEKVKSAADKIQSPLEKKIIESYLAYMEKPSAGKAEDLSEALINIAGDSSDPKNLSFGGLFEALPFAYLSVRWSNWIEQGDVDAITALLTYILIVQTDGAESESTRLSWDIVKQKHSVSLAKARIKCRELFADKAALSTLRDRCLSEMPFP